MIDGPVHQQSQSSYSKLAFDQRLGHLADTEMRQRESKRFKRLIASAKLKVYAESGDLTSGCPAALAAASN